MCNGAGYLFPKILENLGRCLVECFITKARKRILYVRIMRSLFFSLDI